MPAARVISQFKGMGFFEARLTNDANA